MDADQGPHGKWGDVGLDRVVLGWQGGFLLFSGCGALGFWFSVEGFERDLKPYDKGHYLNPNL